MGSLEDTPLSCEAPREPTIYLKVKYYYILRPKKYYHFCKITISSCKFFKSNPDFFLFVKKSFFDQWLSPWNYESYANETTFFVYLSESFDKIGSIAKYNTSKMEIKLSPRNKPVSPPAFAMNDKYDISSWLAILLSSNLAFVLFYSMSNKTVI